MDCKNCGLEIEQAPEKALSGEVQMVWADVEGSGWVCTQNDEEHEPGVFQLSAIEAMDYGIFALNTYLHPDASSQDDVDALDRVGRHVSTVLCEIREWVIAQGEDFEDRLDQDRNFDQDGNRITPAE